MTGRAAGSSSDPKFERPILIVSPPRSGSTLLFETLAKAPGLYSRGRESHAILEGLPGFHPADRGWHSNRLTAEDARTESARRFADGFYEGLRDRDGRGPMRAVRVLEKTPKNSLRIPFFAELWPDSQFVYLYRDGRETLASMMEAWASGVFRTYQRLPNWPGYQWSMLLVPGWESLRGQPLPVVVAHQWAITTNIILDDLAALPRKRVRSVRQSALLADPEGSIRSLAGSLDLDWDRELAGTLPLSRSIISPPRAEKWRRLEREIEEIWPIVAETDERARAFAARFDVSSLAHRSQMTISAPSNK